MNLAAMPLPVKPKRGGVPEYDPFWSLVILEQGPGDRRGLLTAGSALEGLVGADMEGASMGVSARRAAKSLGQAGLTERRLALGFRIELGEEGRQRGAPVSAFFRRKAGSAEEAC